LESNPKNQQSWWNINSLQPTIDSQISTIHWTNTISMNFFWTTSAWLFSHLWRPPFVNNINIKITKKNYNEQKGNNEWNGLILYNVLPDLCKVIAWVVILMEIWKKRKKKGGGVSTSFANTCACGIWFIYLSILTFVTCHAQLEMETCEAMWLFLM